MNVKRYTIAGGVSLAIHASFLFVTQESKSYAMPAGEQSQVVSLNLAAAPTPVQKVEQKSVEVSKSVKPPKVAPPQAAAKTEATPTKTKTATKKPKPEPVKKVVAKKPVEQKKVVEKIEKTIEQPKPIAMEKAVEQKVITDTATEKPDEFKPEVKPSMAAAKKGANSKPVLVEKPSFLSKPAAPKYPRLATKRGIEGVARYEVWLDENGKQIKQVLITSSGATILDKSALDAIKKWRFSPHSVNGQRTAHRVQIPVRFKLD